MIIPLRAVQLFATIIPSFMILVGAHSTFHDISVGGGSQSSVIWACLTRSDDGDDGTITKAIDCFNAAEARFNDGIYNPEYDPSSTFSTLSGDYNQVAVGGSGSSSSVWSCAPTTDATVRRIDCFLASDGLNNDDGEYSVRGTLAGDYEEVSIGGGTDSTVWACAVKRNSGNVDCFLPRDAYTSEDGILFVRGTVSGDYSSVSIRKGVASDTWACATKTDGSGLDCFRLDDFTNGAITVLGTLAGNYDQVSLGSGAAGNLVWACARKTDSGQLDCFPPDGALNNGGAIQVQSSLTGDYRQVAVGGGTSKSFWACAPKSDGSQIDCFLPYEGYSNEGIYEVKASLSGNYTQVAAGGGDSSSVWVCALRASGVEIDCFMTDDSTDGAYEVIATYFADSPTKAPITSIPTTPMSPSTSPPTTLPTADDSAGCVHQITPWLLVSIMAMIIMSRS